MHSLKARALDLMTRAEAAITDFASETARPVDAPLFAGFWRAKSLYGATRALLEEDYLEKKR